MQSIDQEIPWFFPSWKSPLQVLFFFQSFPSDFGRWPAWTFLFFFHTAHHPAKNDQTFQKKMMEKPNTNYLRVAFGTGLNRHHGLSQRMSRVYFYINSNIHQLGYVQNPTFSQLWPQNLHSQTLKVRCFQSQHIQKTCEGIGALGVSTWLAFQ